MNPTTVMLYLMRIVVFIATIAPAYAQEQREPAQAAAPAVETVEVAAEPPAAPPRAITRITLSNAELPTAARRELPAFQPQPPARQFDRDVLTLRAARAAMLQQDASHKLQRLAGLR